MENTSRVWQRRSQLFDAMEQTDSCVVDPVWGLLKSVVVPSKASKNTVLRRVKVVGVGTIQRREMPIGNGQWMYRTGVGNSPSEAVHNFVKEKSADIEKQLEFLDRLSTALER